MIENQPNELTLIYHSDKADDKKARAFIESVTDYVVKTLDLKRESLTETQLAEIAGKMNVRIELLIGECGDTGDCSDGDRRVWDELYWDRGQL